MSIGVYKYKYLSKKHRKKLRKTHIGKIPWNKGKHLSEEMKKKRKELLKKNNWVHPMKGKHLSKEVKRKISESEKGKKISKEQIEKTVRTRMKNGSYIMSKKTKRKISKALKGKRAYWYGKHHSEETKKKISKTHKGMIPWNKGLGNKCSENKKERKSLKFKQWREAVFKRDNYTCQKTKIKGGILHPHHIYNFADYPELRFDVNNGITLSKKAHIEFHKIYGKRNNTKEQLEKFLKR